MRLHAQDDDAVRSPVRGPVAAEVSPSRLVVPEDAGVGLTPHRAAKDASERSRPWLSPAVMSGWPAISVPTPCWAIRVRRGTADEPGQVAVSLGDLLGQHLTVACQSSQRSLRRESSTCVGAL
jgi:hypothetical protein